MKDVRKKSVEKNPGTLWNWREAWDTSIAFLDNQVGKTKGQGSNNHEVYTRQACLQNRYAINAAQIQARSRRSDWYSHETHLENTPPQYETAEVGGAATISTGPPRHCSHTFFPWTLNHLEQIWSWGQWNQIPKVLNPTASYGRRLHGGEYSLHYQLLWFLWKLHLKNLDPPGVFPTVVHTDGLYIYLTQYSYLTTIQKILPIITYPKNSRL